MDMGRKQFDTGFYSGVMAKKFIVIHDVRTKSNLGMWRIGFDLTFIKSNGQGTIKMLHKIVMPAFKIIVKNWNRDRRE